MAVQFFQTTFNHNIQQLLQYFPVDYIVEETGIPFWSGRKRAPRPIELDINDPLHLQLISATANIIADVVKLPKNSNKHFVGQLASNVKLTPFQPKKRVKNNKIEQKNKENKDSPFTSNEDNNSKTTE